MVTADDVCALEQGAQLQLTARRLFLVGALVLAGAAWLVPFTSAQAALVVSPTSLALELARGEIGIVRGDITNTTGFDLQGTDFFGSFSGYPSDALVINQLLGLTYVVIDDRAITSGLDLFSVQLGVGAQAGQSYLIDFFFGDINGNFSPSTTVVVTVSGAQPIPEPNTAWLVGCGTLGLVAISRRRKLRGTQEG